MNDIDSIRVALANLRTFVTDRDTDNVNAHSLIDQRIADLTRRITALESAQKGERAQEPTGYETWSNADLVATTEYHGQYSPQTRRMIREELLRRLDRVVD